MTKVVFFVFLVAIAASALSAPAEEEFEIQHGDGSVRLPRATCDLISAFGVADSACAAHCLIKKYKGGWCEKGVCHCRR